MVEIRTFQNADLPQLAELWCIHHATYRTPPAVNRAVFEQAIASRLFFDPAHLLVATNDGHPIAWCHWFPGDNKVGTLAALCFQTDPTAIDAVHRLLGEFEQRARSSGMESVCVGIHYNSAFGYQGLEPVGHGFGVDVADDRTNTLLEAAGYQETKRIDRWEVSTSDYRAAANRDMLLLRRSAVIQPEKATALSPRLAAAMIHFEVERYKLIDSRSHALLATVELWTSDPEALVMPASQAILASWSRANESNLATDDFAVRYLISALIPQLSVRRIRSLQRSVSTTNLEEAKTLMAANFSRTSAGRLMSKKLT
jgi:hypothetical protein